MKQVGIYALVLHVLAASLPVRLRFASGEASTPPAEPCVTVCPCAPEPNAPCCCEPTAQPGTADPVPTGPFLLAGKCGPQTAVLLTDSPATPATAPDRPALDFPLAPGRPHAIDAALGSLDPAPPVPPPRLG